MLIISDLDDYEPDWKESVLTLGDFDGIHKGHRYLIEKTVETAAGRGAAPVLVTYDPSPKKVLKKLKHDSLIYTKDEKICLLQNFPLKAVVFIPFSDEFARISARRYLHEILLKKLKAKHIILGYDHHFGRNRRGNYSYLKMAAQKYPFEVERIQPVKLIRSPVSSTRIRDYLSTGHIKKANKLLTEPYFIRNTVIRGRQRGSSIGVPTANLRVPPEKLLLSEGVYYGRADYGGRSYKTVVNIGFNPTFENVDLSVEAHLLDFNKDIYGEALTVYFYEKIRDEQKFDGIEQLVGQIKKDISYAELKPL